MQQSSQLFSSGADPSGPRCGPEGFHTVTSAPPSYTLQIHHETWSPRWERPSLRNIFGATSQWHHLFLFLLEQPFFLYILALSFNSLVAEYDNFVYLLSFSLLLIPFSGWHHLRQLLIISHLKRWWRMALCCLWKGPQHKSNTPYSGAFELCINSTWLFFYRVENWFSPLVWAQQLLSI